MQTCVPSLQNGWACDYSDFQLGQMFSCIGRIWKHVLQAQIATQDTSWNVPGKYKNGNGEKYSLKNAILRTDKLQVANWQTGGGAKFALALNWSDLERFWHCKSLTWHPAWNGNSQKKYDGTAPVRNTCENLASQTWPNWRMHVAKLEDAGQGALLKLCVKKIFIEMA